MGLVTGDNGRKEEGVPPLHGISCKERRSGAGNCNLSCGQGCFAIAASWFTCGIVWDR